MLTVAIIGPDGAGKSTLIEGLRRELDMPKTYIYMGINPDAINVMLPTTRLIKWFKQITKRSNVSDESHRAAPTISTANSSKSGNPIKTLLRGIKSFLFVINRMAEQWYRIVVAYIYIKRGYLVLFDRHFFLDYRVDYYGVKDADRSFFRRLLNWQLEHLYPRPHMTLYLDAPAEVLFARKGEGTLELLQQKRDAYQNLGDVVPYFTRLDATQTPDEVLQQALNAIHALCNKHSTKAASTG